MKILPTEIPDVIVIEPDVFGDERGFFMESWNRQRYRDAGITDDFVQDNFSLSRRGILRGMHFQNPKAQGKLVSALQGEVLDVAVDLRTASPTFKRWVAVVLSSENKRQMFVPPGFAHGFLVLSETALFHYKCTELYARAHERSFRWDDPEIGIAWPVREPVLSERDKRAPLFRDLPREQLFQP